jgi:phosphatidylglycerophosphatase C
MARTVLFDFDGVLVAGDSFASWLRHQGLRPLPRRLLALGLAPIGIPLLTWTRTRSLGARLFMHLATLGADPVVLRASITAFGRDLARRPGKVIAQGIDRLRAHLDVGDRVIVISGSESTLVETILDELGIDGVEVVASQLEHSGRMARVRRHCFGAAKLTALAEVGVVPPWDIAYSDSPNDLPMLRGAREAVCVNWPDAQHALLVVPPGACVRHVRWS